MKQGWHWKGEEEIASCTLRILSVATQLYLLVLRLKHKMSLSQFRFSVRIFHLKTAISQSQGIRSLLLMSLTVKNR